MDAFENYKPTTAKQRKLIERYHNLSRLKSKLIREVDENDRLLILRELDPCDTSLLDLYVQALKQEDYETCAVAKVILVERGFDIPI